MTNTRFSPAWADSFSYQTIAQLLQIMNFQRKMQRYRSILTPSNETYYLLARRAIVGAVETPGVEYKDQRGDTKCHVIIGHRQQPRDTWPRYSGVQYWERHVAYNFKRRHHASLCEENLPSRLYFLQTVSQQYYCLSIQHVLYGIQVGPLLPQNSDVYWRRYSR